MFIAMSVSVNKTYSAADLKFLNLLSEKFPTIADATTEIINLEAILNLPKGTPGLVPSSTARDQKNLSSPVMDMPVVSAAWLKGNISNHYARCRQHILITLANKVFRKGVVLFSNWKNTRIFIIIFVHF